MSYEFIDDWELNDDPDRRKKPRFLFEKEIGIVLQSSGVAISAKGADISPEGLKFFAEQHFAAEEEVTIQLSEGLSFQAVIRTVYEPTVGFDGWEMEHDDEFSIGGDNEGYYMGAEFKELTPEQKKELSDYISKVLI